MEPAARYTFRLLPDRLAICRLDPGAAVPDWAQGGFVCVTRTAQELSVVCGERHVPAGVRFVRGRRALGIEGVVDFATIGLIAALAAPLAAAGISIYVVSTYDTDWLLVEERDLARTLEILRAAGHTVAD